jgi:hypothetical protein
MNLNIFGQLDFLSALKSFFKNLKVPVNYIADEPVVPKEILSSTYRETEAFQLMNDVYFVGMIDDAAFAGNKSPEVSSIRSDYDGILIFGVELKKRINGLLPTRGQLAEISRAFNREFHFTPVVVIFKYNGLIAFANTERIKYKQGWREGEKAGKVSVLRDVNIQSPHRGHLEILKELEIPTSGKNAVDSFASLYKYWQEVFSVSILNKKFYNELQNWYFWAIKEVSYPNAPNRFDFDNNERFDEAVKEHKGKNVIRLLTRILFIWFIKEKKLIPEQLFDEKFIANKLIKDFTPQKPRGIFATGKQNSTYYRAILQNLFFATLNQEMGKRAFRGEGQHQNVTNLMRYKSYFKDPEYFVQMMEEVVPFMNGGLFECLDKPHPTIKGKQGGDIIIYNDGFSDRDDNSLVVPDYLFFDVDEDVDLSDDFGNKVYKNSKTRGLLEILLSYKFTITENTPIEEDVALDPELLGKVFENLLASYNPETKTTARKQTGSFYTPREIVNYMVDESLIAYLKNSLKDDIMSEEQLEQDLHQLLSYDTINPYQDNPEIQKKLIKALDQCTILDPACGSGAFPMGILQKMVHVLHKIDPKNTEWEQRQIERVNKAIENLEELDDVRFREQSVKDLKAQIKDIEDSFENNELDYGRKLYLIENCIYGVDIQSIATQISKLRFFISLIVDQKIDKTKDNFGIRPLPNLETKFVAANTLIGIEKPKAQLNLFENQEIKKLEAELKKVRHKLFSSKSPTNKRKLREEDKELRNRIADLLVNDGWEYKTARQLASWDPYDQNESSPFFDPEWMFDVSDGFDVVIGNPPYIGANNLSKELRIVLNSTKEYKTLYQKWDIYIAFIEKGIRISKNGITCMIVPYPILNQTYAKKLRDFIHEDNGLLEITNLSGNKIFDEATVTNCILFVKANYTGNKNIRISKLIDGNIKIVDSILKANIVKDEKTSVWDLSNKVSLNFCGEKFKNLGDYCFISKGMVLNADEKKSRGLFTKNDLVSNFETEINCKKYTEAKYITKYGIERILFLEWGTERVPSLISRPTFPRLYECPKLLVSKIGKIKATIDNSNLYCDQTIRVLVLWHDLKDVKNKSISNSISKFQTNSRVTLESNSLEVNLNYLLALINSKLANYILDQIRGIGNIDINPEYLKNIPIPKIDIEAQTPFIKLVDKILNTKEENPQTDTSVIERKIDEMVFRLYELTYNEVKVVDPYFWLSEEEYAAVEI